MAKFLTEYFYNKLYPGTKRITEKKEQLAGIDIILPDGSKVDEKCMFYPIGQKSKNIRPYNTFAFECSFKRYTGKRITGWFLDKEKETEYYLLCWIHDCKVTSNPTKNDFLEVEIAMINRAELQNELASHKLSLNKIQKDSEHIRNISRVTSILNKDELNGRFKTRRYCSDYHYYKNGKDYTDAYYVYSKQLAEEPMNLILSKELLLSLPSTKHWFVTPNYISEVTSKAA